MYRQWCPRERPLEKTLEISRFRVVWGVFPSHLSPGKTPRTPQTPLNQLGGLSKGSFPGTSLTVHSVVTSLWTPHYIKFDLRLDYQFDWRTCIRLLYTKFKFDVMVKFFFHKKHYSPSVLDYLMPLPGDSLQWLQKEAYNRVSWNHQEVINQNEIWVTQMFAVFLTDHIQKTKS